MMVSINQRIASAEKPVFLALVDPVTGEPFKDGDKEQGLLVVSPLSKSYAQRTAKIQQKYLGMAGSRAAKTGDVGETALLKELDGLTEDMADEIADAQLLCVVGWQNMDVVDDQGNVLEFSPENLKRLVTSAPWIVDQVARFLQDTSNFFTEPKGDLPPGSDTKSGSLKPTTRAAADVTATSKLRQLRASRHQN